MKNKFDEVKQWVIDQAQDVYYMYHNGVNMFYIRHPELVINFVTLLIVLVIADAIT
jgi:hypothetical protein